MKKFLGKHWKDIIYFFAVIGIVISLYASITTPATIVKDYAEYGPYVEQRSDAIDVAKDGKEIVKEESKDGVDHLTEYVQEQTNADDGTARTFVIAVLALLGVFILSNILDSREPAPAKKK